MTRMRDIAFGKSAKVETFRTCKRAEEMRNDQQMIDDAQAKRERKNAKRAAMLAKGGAA